MKESLNLALVQANLAWENPNENFNNFEKMLKTIKNSPDIIVLPEMFSTGFSMKSNQLAEDSNNSKSLTWMQSISKQFNCLVIGSIIVKDKKQFHNRLYVTQPDKPYEYYDKRHLFRMANEHDFYTAGKKRITLSYKGWKICPLICYDLRFPVFSRNTYNKGTYDYDVLIYIANWPKARVNAWKDLLKARAHENLSYVTGVNRVGVDGNNIEYSGDSTVIDFKGRTLSHSSTKEVIETSLDYKELLAYREKFPAGKDADFFEIKP